LNLNGYLQEKKDLVDAVLNRYLPPAEKFPRSVHQAMRHILFAGGKRLRPVLALSAGELVGGNTHHILPCACALELIHTYSLIHDDLPAMDNDDCRRGILTTHKQFGEATAILAGDALLTEAFRLLSCEEVKEKFPEGVLIEMINEVAFAAGSGGMIGGQVVDIESGGKEIDLPLLEYIHTHKTGALILASVRMGAKLGGAKATEIEALTRYGESLGLAFQIVDDLLNVEGDSEEMGKASGTDAAQSKATYPHLLGVSESKRRAEDMVASAHKALEPFGSKADTLKEIATFIISRRH
jgi:geranylgeranyl diphosphate synthase type II